MNESLRKRPCPAPQHIGVVDAGHASDELRPSRAQTESGWRTETPKEEARMSDQHSINVRTVEAYMARRTDDGTQMGLVLRLATGMEGFAFSHKDFALFAAKLLDTAVTETQLPSPTQDSP